MHSSNEEKRRIARRQEDANVNDIVARHYRDRPWWKRFAMRAEVVPAYIFLSIALTLGVWAVNKVSSNRADDAKREANIAKTIAETQQSIIDDICARLDSSGARFTKFINQLAIDLGSSPETLAIVQDDLVASGYSPTVKTCDDKETRSDNP